MVCSAEYYKEVVLLRPEAPLLLQVADWVALHGRYALNVFSSETTGGFEQVLSGADRAIVDASEPLRAKAVAQQAIGAVGIDRVAVYASGPIDRDLANWARSCGVGVLQGPLTRTQWDAFFDSTWQATAA